MITSYHFTNLRPLENCKIAIFTKNAILLIFDKLQKGFFQQRTYSCKRAIYFS